MTVLILGILVGLDNLQVASAIGLLGLQPKRKWLLVAGFVFFETTMPLVGLLIGHKLNHSFESIAEWLGPGIMMALGLYILVREWMEKEPQDLANRKGMLLLLPLFMSLDNLLAGLGLGTSGYPVISTSITVGICAGSMCILGLFIGEKLRQLIPGNLEVVSGLYLIGVAVFLVMK